MSNSQLKRLAVQTSTPSTAAQNIRRDCSTQGSFTVDEFTTEDAEFSGAVLVDAAGAIREYSNSLKRKPVDATPETDAAKFVAVKTADGDPFEYVVNAEVSARLERRLRAAGQLNAWLKDHAIFPGDWQDVVDLAMRAEQIQRAKEAAEARLQPEALRAVLTDAHIRKVLHFASDGEMNDAERANIIRTGIIAAITGGNGK